MKISESVCEIVAGLQFFTEKIVLIETGSNARRKMMQFMCLINYYLVLNMIVI